MMSISPEYNGKLQQYKLPEYLAAPKLLDFGDGSIVKNIYCYILRHYGSTGIGVLYYANGEDIIVQFGDWNGRLLDLNKTQEPLVRAAQTYLCSLNTAIYNLLHTMAVPQAQLFLTSELVLVDIQVAINKLVGPGMLQNLFGRIVKIPEVLGIEIIDQRAIDAIDAGSGMYAGNIILKPSRFRHFQLSNQKYTPLYAQVNR